MLTRGKALLAVLLAVVAVGGCGRSQQAASIRHPGGSPSPTPSPSPVTPPPSPSAAPAKPSVNGLTISLPAGANAEQQAVLAGYRAFWEGLLGAAAKADPHDPGLVSTTTGTANHYFFGYVQSLRTKRQTKSGAVILAPTVASMTGPNAAVADCADFLLSRVRDASGRAIHKLDLLTTSVRVGMVRVGQRWLAETYHEVGSGCRLGT